MEFGKSPDEIKQYLDARYVGAYEAVWRLMRHEIHHQEPAVVDLSIHLPEEQMVLFNDEALPEEVMDKATNSKSKLMAYFETNATDVTAHEHLYINFPKHYTWQASQRKWKARRMGTAIGRLHFVPPTAGERFYLRLLLMVVKGSKSFVELRGYQGIEYQTFKAACLARGLLEDDSEWRQCLQEAAGIQTGSQLRRLFVTILIFSTPSNAGALWDEFKVHICDDLEHQLRTKHAIPEQTEEQVYAFGLFLCDKILQQSGKSLDLILDMPQVVGQWEQITGNRLIAQQRSYDPQAESEMAEEYLAKLNAGQREAYDQILASVINKEGRLFFVNGPGGCGKSFLWNTLGHTVRGQQLIVLCIASSGIAALILIGGQTTHSALGVPIDIHGDSFCNIKKGSMKAELLRHVSLIIWDEPPMQHHHVAEAVDRTLRDILDEPDRPFGGITVAWGGDFQQTLPVVVKGTKEDIVSACVQRSPLWQHVTILCLTENMHVDQSNADSMEFSEWLLDVGHGRNLPLDHSFTIPPHMKLEPATLPALICEVYPNIGHGDSLPDSHYLERCILCPRNAEVDEVNALIIQDFPGDVTAFHSVDSASSANEDLEDYPVEYLNSLDMSGMPPSHLHLKIGVPLLLLRNLDQAQGLCNGTRLRLLKIFNRVLQVSKCP